MVYTKILDFKHKYNQAIIALLCGMFGILAFSPYDFWPASIVSLIGLFIVILNNTWKKTIWYTLLWGLGFFSVGLHWIYFGITQFFNTNNTISILLIGILVIYLTCFPILFSISFFIIKNFIKQEHLINIVAAILWLITERLRGNSYIGFPWLQFGYSQIDGPMKGIAPILGVEGITFTLVFISGLIALSIKKIQLLPFFISLCVLFFVYPLTWIQWYHVDPHKVITVSLVQGNITQNLNWDINNIKTTLQIYLKHTLPLIGKTNIIIWPESAIPGSEISHNKFLTALDYQLRQNHTYLITGIIDTRYINNNYYHYNSIIVLGDKIPYIYPSNNRYTKHHLVLCSERFPCQSFFQFLFTLLNIPIIFMSTGHYLQPQLNIKNIKMTAAICYEIILGNQIRDNFKFNSDLLLVLTNDGWFGHSIGPWQHFQMTRMRGLELGRPILCCTNNGITAIIHADGSIKSQISQFISTVLTENISPSTGHTPYAQFGSSWLIIIIIISSIYLIISLKNYFFCKKNNF